MIPISLLTLVVTGLLTNPTTAVPVPVPVPAPGPVDAHYNLLLRRGTCNPSPGGPADRRGASAVAQMLIDEANLAADRESGGLLTATAEYTTVANYSWQDDEGISHQTFVQIRILPSAMKTDASGGTETAEALMQVEIPRRNVYGTVMDLIFGCADHECLDSACPVGGETVPLSNPIVQIKLTGTS